MCPVAAPLVLAPSYVDYRADSSIGLGRFTDGARPADTYGDLTSLPERRDLDVGRDRSMRSMANSNTATGAELVRLPRR